MSPICHEEAMMAEAAIIAASAALPGAARPGGVESAHRPVAPARIRCRVETPPGNAKAAPPSDAAVTDYTDFSMVGVAG
jgi:hypothetical protein